MYGMSQNQVNGRCKHCKKRISSDEFEMNYNLSDVSSNGIPLRHIPYQSKIRIHEDSSTDLDLALLEIFNLLNRPPAGMEHIQSPPLCNSYKSLGRCTLSSDRPMSHCSNKEILNFPYSLPDLSLKSGKSSNGTNSAEQNSQDDDLSFISHYIGKATNYVGDIYLDLPSLDLSRTSTDRSRSDMLKKMDQTEVRKLRTTNWDKPLQTKISSAHLNQLPHNPNKEFSTKLTTVLTTKVLTPIVIKIQELLIKNRLEQLELMKELQELPDLLGKVLKKAAKDNKAGKAFK